jgi:hypothetical protein
LGGATFVTHRDQILFICLKLEYPGAKRKSIGNPMVAIM